MPFNLPARGFAPAVAVLLSGLLCSSPALAGSAGPGHITGIVTTNSGAAFFNDSGTRTGSPSCASGNPVRWVLNDATPAGQGMLSMLLTAYSLGRSITVMGTGVCDLDSATETVGFFFIDD